MNFLVSFCTIQKLEEVDGAVGGAGGEGGEGGGLVSCDSLKCLF